MVKNKKVRVRYAPSPTGYLHIGGARSALFNYVYAKKYKGDFIIRIEDTDIERNIKGAEQSQIEDLEWLGLKADESPFKPNKKYAPYRQTEKLDIYKKYAKELLDKGYAYECYCTEDELAEMKEEQLSRGVKSFKYDRHCLNLSKEEIDKYKKEGRKPTIRLKMEKGVTFKFNDLVRGEVSFLSDDIGDFVIMKSNGIPTYNFAVVIDDYLMEVSHILRGEEHLSNTPKQLQIYKYFGREPPLFGHMTIIVNEKGKKLSKRDNDIVQFISQYKEQGYLPEAIFNFLYLLGYSSVDNKEFFTMDEAIESFDPSRLSSSPSMFEIKKLQFINSYYIKHLDDKAYFKFITPYIQKVKGLNKLDNSTLLEYSLIFKNEIIKGEDITSFLNQIINYEENVISKEEKDLLKNSSSKLVIKSIKEKISSFNEDFDKDNVNLLFKEVQKETSLKGKDLYMPIRLALTNMSHGVEMYNIFKILKKKEILKRLNKLLS